MKLMVKPEAITKGVSIMFMLIGLMFFSLGVVFPVLSHAFNFLIIVGSVWIMGGWIASNQMKSTKKEDEPKGFSQS